MAWEVRYKVRPGEWERPEREQWPVWTPEPRTEEEAGAAVTEILRRHRAHGVTVFEIKSTETERIRDEKDCVGGGGGGAGAGGGAGGGDQ